MTAGTASVSFGGAGDAQGGTPSSDAGAGRSTGGRAPTNAGRSGAGRGGDAPETGSAGEGGANGGAGGTGGDGGATEGGEAGKSDGGSGGRLLTRCSSHAPFGEPTRVLGLPEGGIRLRLNPDETVGHFASYFQATNYDVMTATRGARSDAFGESSAININDANWHFSPTLPADGQLLYFEAPDGNGYWKIHQSAWNTEFGFFGPIELAPGLNVAGALYDNGGPYVLPSGEVIYFHSRRVTPGPIMRAVRMGASFGEPEPVEIDLPVATTLSFPVVSSDEQTVYFSVVVSVGSLTTSDIWRATRQANNAFGDAGPVLGVNTQLTNEVPSFISEDGCRLYFDRVSGGLGWHPGDENAYVAEREPDSVGGLGGSGGNSGLGGIGGLGGSGGDGSFLAGEAGEGHGAGGGSDFELVTASDWAEASVECPDDKPWVVGTGARGIDGAGLESVVPESDHDPDTVRVEAGAAGTTIAYAVCSDAMGLQTFESTGIEDSTVDCGNGMVAIGGGGECTGGGKLWRSRPVPDAPGTKPTGWRATCGAGSVTSYAICIADDFKDCHTERVSSKGNALVSCPSGQTAVSAGGYCGNSEQGLLSMELDPELTQVNVACLLPTTNVNAYVICCG